MDSFGEKVIDSAISMLLASGISRGDFHKVVWNVKWEHKYTDKWLINKDKNRSLGHKWDYKGKISIIEAERAK